LDDSGRTDSLRRIKLEGLSYHLTKLSFVWHINAEEMLLRPENRDHLTALLAEASRAGLKISSVDLSLINSLIEHKPEDMTTTVEAGLMLSRLQETLSKSGQWLPIDPPHPDSLTVGDLLAHNVSGPRRFGCGTIRDYLIGVKVAIGNGQIIKAGGKVVKNVAGYDLCKLFVGAKHSLGIIVEATFKLRPLPETEAIMHLPCASLSELNSLARRLLEMPLEPIILDAFTFTGPINLVVGFAGPEEDVNYQIESVNRIGKWIPSSTEYEAEFWRDSTAIQKTSVLASETSFALEKFGGAPFLARLGNGVIYYQGRVIKRPPLPNPLLHQRLKNAYDPKNIFPDYAA
jgi:hypothetical protein